MDRHVYAVERYGPPRRSVDLDTDLAPAGATRLVGVIQLTDDDVALALVEGSDPESVRASMIAAGWRVDRITPAIWTASESAVPDGVGATGRAARDEDVLP